MLRSTVLRIQICLTIYMVASLGNVLQIFGLLKLLTLEQFKILSSKLSKKTFWMIVEGFLKSVQD